jgi:hypothetical protein
VFLLRIFRGDEAKEPHRRFFVRQKQATSFAASPTEESDGRYMVLILM